MRICFSSSHQYPGKLHGVAAHAVHDYLVKGLSELGHKVYYCLLEEPEVPLPPGVIYTPDIRYDVDILHLNTGSPLVYPESQGMPWVKIVHSDIRSKGYSLDAVRDNWIFVSQSLARTYGSERYVYNGIDPDEFIYSEAKSNYLLFVVGGIHRAMEKGLNTALDMARKTGVELRIASSGNDDEKAAFDAFCRREGAVPIGSIHGSRKAEVFAMAKALIMPSQFNEACPLVVMEALMSGTPVIGSANGAIPEMLDETTGFVCKTEADYIHAIENCRKIKPRDCRNAAVERFHYLNMSKGYVREYLREIEKSS